MERTTTRLFSTHRRVGPPIAPVGPPIAPVGPPIAPVGPPKIDRQTSTERRSVYPGSQTTPKHPPSETGLGAGSD
jgi:hypothetical protein